MSFALLFGVLSIGIVILWITVLSVYRKQLLHLWREPVMHCPVLIIESDDWGPGSDEHTVALTRICELLERHVDVSGHTAVMTIGVVLAIADTALMGANNVREYIRKTLMNSQFSSLRRLLRRFHETGVLALQLHGLEHFWPPALMRAAREAADVQDWIMSANGSDTELLPSPLQSRWTDSSTLPSVPLSSVEINAAVDEEVGLYRQCFGDTPSVIVPPTFIWNSEVEKAWARNGVEAVITPGKRYTGRDAEGLPCCIDRQISNGDFSDGNMVYLVRDIYFEPSYGHKAEEVLQQVQRHNRLGRPALLETHRFNFVGDELRQNKSLAEVDRLLSLAQQYWPSTRFVSSEELSRQFKDGVGELLEKRLRVRVRVWIDRAAQIGRLRKLAWATGLVFPTFLVQLVLKGLSPNNDPDNKGNLA